MERDRNLAPTGSKNTNQRQPNPPARPAQEAPDPKIVARLEEFLALLDVESAPIAESPLTTLRGSIFGLNIHEGCGLFFYGRAISSYYAVEAGARETLPAEVGRTLKRIAGPEAAARFERGWRRWRVQIGREAIEAAEKKLFPIPGYGMSE